MPLNNDKTLDGPISNLREILRRPLPGQVPLGFHANAPSTNLWMTPNRNFFFLGQHSAEVLRAAAAGHALVTHRKDSRMLVLSPFRRNPLYPVSMLPKNQVVARSSYKHTLEALTALHDAIRRGRSGKRPRLITVIFDALTLLEYFDISWMIQEGQDMGFYFWLQADEIKVSQVDPLRRHTMGNGFTRVSGSLDRHWQLAGLQHEERLPDNLYKVFMPSGKQVATARGAYVSDYDLHLLVDGYRTWNGNPDSPNKFPGLQRTFHKF